jgi:hypothetical protein
MAFDAYNKMPDISGSDDTFVLVFDSRCAGEKHSATDAARVEGAVMANSRRCSECLEPLGGRTWLPPYRVELDVGGAYFADVVGGAGDLLVSDRFRAIYEENNLTGLSNFTLADVVRILRRPKHECVVPEYYKVDVVRSRACIDLVRSGFEWTRPVSICRECLKGRGEPLMRWKKLVIDPATRGPEDIFMARGANRILLSERFKSVYDANGLKGAILAPAAEHEVDFYKGVPGWSPRNFNKSP